MLKLDHLKKGFAIRCYHVTNLRPEPIELITERRKDAEAIAVMLFNGSKTVYKVHVFDHNGNKILELI